jgi:hypothetical protein
LVENGKHYRHPYIDPLSKKMGSRDSLNAIYTSESISNKQQQFWRELQQLKRKPNKVR